MLINTVSAQLLLFQEGWVEEVVRKESIEIFGCKALALVSCLKSCNPTLI